MKRDWSRVETALTCRVCKRNSVGGGRLERAHVIPRKYDPKGEPVDPRGIVTLCTAHHQEYDAGKLDLLPYLTNREQAYAVERIGLVSALRYISGRESAREIMEMNA